MDRNGMQVGKENNLVNPVIRSKVPLFDCHNHIQDERLFPMLETVMECARAAGVVKMAVKGCCEADWPKVIEIANRFNNVYLAFGLHPWFINGCSEQCFQTLDELLTTYPQASVGEIGIDHAIENRDDAEQERVFLTQLETARKFDRPVTIHCRRAWERLIELLDQFGELPRGMLIHCFGGSAEVATELVKRGAYISFSGSITRPEANQAGAAIRAVSDDRILIETDAPDILPFNVDGASISVLADQRALLNQTELEAPSTTLNEPANLRLVLAKAAELRGVSEESLAQLTFANAERFFNWADHGQGAHATGCRTGILPVAAHGQDAHATECRTGFQPVISVGQHLELSVQLPKDYALGTRLEEFHIRHGAHLPHWTREGGVYAATFRLADSLPQPVLVSWKTERDNIVRNAEQQKRPLSVAEENRLQQLYSQKVESYLDAGHGECGLRRDGVAKMMAEVLQYFDGKRYDLLAWCIMPNHVHVVLHPLKGFGLPEILHSWKSYSATKANQLLEREGAFWQAEYYDHLIRDEADFRHAVEYVLGNPEKAGVMDWPWRGLG